MKVALVGAAVSLFLSAQAVAGAPPPPQATPAPVEAGSEPQTLTAGMSSGPAFISGWFLAPTIGTTGFGGELAYSPGLRGGIYLNKRVAIGLTGQAVASKSTDFGDHGVRNLGSYGGLLLQYVVQSDRLVHTTFESTIGSGRWCNVINDDNDGCSGRDFLVFEPMANIEINVAKHVRLATGVGYRFAVAGSGNGPSSREMSSLVARTSLVLGSF